MFSQVSVILLWGGRQTPTLPSGQRPPLDKDPLWTETPPGQRPPGKNMGPDTE